MASSIKLQACAAVALAVLTSIPAFAAEKPPAPAAPAGSTAAPANDYKLQLSGWSYGRERKTITGSNRVTANLTIKNSSADAVRDVNVSVTYLTGTGEKVANPVKKTVGALKAGETQKLTIVAEFIPIFAGYEILVEYNGKQKEAWYSNCDVSDPEPKAAGPQKGIANVVILGKEASGNRAGGFSGTVRVKNEGTEEAKGLKVTVVFYNDKKKQIGEWSGKLGTGTLAGGMEKNIPFTADRAVPKIFAGFELKVSHDDAPLEAALSGGDFTTAEALEFAKFQFTRPDPKSTEMSVAAQVRNGMPFAIEHAKLTMTFYGPKKKVLKTFSYEVPGALESKEIKPIAFSIPGLPNYEEYEQSVAFDKAGGVPATAQTRIEAGKFKNVDDVEVVFTDCKTADDKSITLSGATRNGKKNAVKDIAVHVTFKMPDGKDLECDTTIAGPVESGTEQNFELKAPGAAGFKEYSLRFNSQEVPPAKSEAPVKKADSTEDVNEALGKAL